MKKLSVKTATIAVIICIVAAVGLGIAAPWLAELFCRFRGLTQQVGRAVLISYYVCLAPALVSLYCLLKLLSNISRDEMFDRKNPFYMSVVSYCCLCVAAASGVCGFLYMPMFFICAAMLFLFLIVRVVRMCFVAATEIKEENDYTV